MHTSQIYGINAYIIKLNCIQHICSHKLILPVQKTYKQKPVFWWSYYKVFFRFQQNYWNGCMVYIICRKYISTTTSDIKIIYEVRNYKVKISICEIENKLHAHGEESTFFLPCMLTIGWFASRLGGECCNYTSQN